MGRYTRKGYELDQTGQEAQDLLNAINNKVDKEDGKSLISDEDKAKLDNIEERAQRNTIETIKRNGVALPIDDKGVNISVPTKVVDLEQDYTHRTVTDAEKDKWNDKQEKPAPVRYAVLKSMRDTGGLTVGKTYRITDYVATVRRSAQYSEAMSANHPFDIIVTAIDERHLSEECLAAMHEGDIYFANSDLSAWKIWYTIDNDTAAYDWADPANGKGVIYRMIDEYANDLGYDFKGILIARHPVTPAEGYEDVLADISGMWLGPKGSAVPAGITVDTTQTKWFYTFSHLTDGWDNPTDASLRKGIKAVYNATITSIMRPNIRFLSGNVFMNGPFVVSTLEALAGPGSEITDAHVWHFRAMGDCSNNTFFGYAGCSDCMSQLRYNIFVGDFRHNRLATDVEGNTIVAPGDISFNDIWCANMVVRAREFSRNSGGGYTSGTVLETSGYVSYNKFPNYFADNRITAAGNISANDFGTSFYQNTFTLTGQFTGNKFTGYCYENNIGCSNFTNNEAAYFHANTISTTEGVNACVFGPYFESNTLGGRLTNVRFSSGQTRFCNFSGIVGCTFDSIMEYVTVPTVSGKRFTHCDVRGGVRGTSSVPVVLDYDAFFLASAAGVSRRVTIEGSADGKIVAMWADGGALKGVMKAPNGNWADMGFVTKAVNDLLNYYLKSETYTKTEVNQLVAGINNWEIVSVAQLPEASADTMHKIYLVPSSSPEASNVKDEYITIENSGIYSWEQIGSTTIDLTNYVTKQEFTIALADYVTSSAFTQALATKQDTLVSGQNIKTINGFSILGGGNLYFPGPVQSDWNEDDDGDDAYIKNKPTDLVHYDELSPTDPISTPNYATEEEVSQLRSEVDRFDAGNFDATISGYIDANGVYHSGGNYKVTDYIRVVKNQVIRFTTSYSSVSPLLWGYSDKNGNDPIALWRGSSASNQKIGIPENVEYIRLWGYSSATVNVKRDSLYDDIVFGIDGYGISFPLAWPTSISNAITPNIFFAVKNLVISDSIPSVIVGVKDSGQDLLANFQVAVVKMTGTIPACLYKGDISVHTRGTGFAIITLDLQYSGELAGANIFILPKERVLGYVSNSDTNLSALLLNSDLSYNTETSSYLPLVGFVTFQTNTLPSVVTQMNLAPMLEYQTLKDRILQGGKIIIEDGTYNISETINVPSNTHIIGNGNVKLIASSGCDCIFSVEGKENVVIEGISFQGQAVTIPSSATISDIKQKSGIGAQVGISITGTYCAVIIDKCNFTQFSKAAVYLRITSGTSSNRKCPKITNSFFSNCYIGIFDDFRFEYCNFDCLSIDNCYVGIWCEGGNNQFTNIHIDQHNKAGFVLSGLQNGNEGHSTISTCSFNHNDNFSLVVLNVDNGEIIDACNFFDSKIYIENSKGIVFVANHIAPTDIEIVGGSLSGKCMFANNIFSSSYGFTEISNTDNVPLEIVNNINS